MSEENKKEALEEEVVDTTNEATEAQDDNSEWKFDAVAHTLSDGFLDSIGVDKGEFETAQRPVKKVEPKKTNADERQQNKTNKNDKVIFALVSVLLIVCIAALSVLGVLYYNKPNSNEKLNPGNVAVTVGDTKISIGMYNYYYTVVTNDYTSYSGYEGYPDSSKPYDEQFTTDDDGNKISWADLFTQKTIDQINLIAAYYDAGIKEGITLTKNQKDGIKSTIDYLKQTAAENEMSVDAYISSNYGDYCGLATINSILTQRYIAENYYQKRVIDNKVTAKEEKAQYEKNRNKYDAMSVAYLQIPYGESNGIDTGVDEKTAVANANSYVKQIHSVNDMKKLIPVACKTIIDYYVEQGYYQSADACAEALASSIQISLTADESALQKDASEWLFADTTKIGECKAFNDTNNKVVYIFYKISDLAPDKTTVYSVRHILVTPEADDEEANGGTVEYTKEQWAAAKKKADSIVTKYNKTGKTEYDFAQLAETYSDDTESTSSGQSGYYGGLYEGVGLGTMVPEFENWSIDNARKYGDIDIVKSTYGYHIMFFVEKTENYLYKAGVDVKDDREDDFIKSSKIKKHKSAMKKTTVAQPKEADDENANENHDMDY